ncbi:hypothetical protein [Ulvibacterium marinum]|uniref:Peptidase S74 domain-containing protein n=1 Tax=Ulvibacterium marinum TaxID=2419782 RepID=A0A3B0CFC6_9FLAO|nr:hypothetical protein [Ulvibacterium marinum]RKN81806.1 hypothetical protein D7Z94_13040 [Ulvibacterium marinum]
MKKTSSPTRSCSHLLLTVTALLFLSIPGHAQIEFDEGIRLNDSGALSLHPNIPFEIDEPKVVGGRFRVTTTGLVGIGVISPTEKLEVAGKIKADGIRINKGLLSLHPDATFNIDEPGIVGGRFTIGKDGNVGIGVADPKFPLDVAKAITSSTFPYGWVSQFKNANTNSGVILGGRQKNDKGYAIIGSMGTTSLTINPDGGDIHLGSQFSTATNVYGSGRFNLGYVTTENLTVSENIIAEGNVGIGGVTSPSERLEVNGNIKATGKIIADGGIALNNISESMYFAENGNVGIGVTAPTEKLQVAGNIKATGKIIADGGIEMNGSEALHFSKEGNVGIGVAEPTQKLEVNGVIKTSHIRVEDGMNVKNGIRMENGALSFHPSALLVLDKNGVPGGRFIVTSIEEDGMGGNVGIGVDTPSEKLEVNGNIKATGNLLLENDDDPDNPIPVFQVSTAEQLTFIGSEAYTKWTENNTNKDSELYKNKDKYSLWVSKGIVSEDYVMASVDAWADYVFDPGYKLRSLEELSHFVRTNKHLPNIPSEAEVKQEGYSLHELNRGFLKTIEELTLHTIAQEEKIKTLNAQLEQYEHLSDEVAQLKAALAQLQQDQD